MLYIQGLGSDASVPTSTWTAFQRNQTVYKGVTLLFGGPLFIHQLSQGFLDFKYKRDTLGYDYWVASKLATLENRQYEHIGLFFLFAQLGTNCFLNTTTNTITTTIILQV